MKIEIVKKESFVVIGKEGSSKDGEGFIQKLWKDASNHFDEVANLAKKKANGYYQGFWGAMSDYQRLFQPWENNFSEGLYCAGVECEDNVICPIGWVKWTIPSYEYYVVEVENENTFQTMIDYLKSNNISLVGAVHDYTDAETNKNYMYFPIKKL